MKKREFINSNTIRTDHWHALKSGRIQCDICPRGCKLDEGQKGFCFVRERQGDEIVLTTYGRSSGFCIDPIEKKPLNHFYPGSSVLSFGTAGCNLGCKFCQNWDISKSKEIDRLSSEAGPEQIARAAEDLDCTSVAFTYNDPVIFFEYAIDTATACRERGIKAVAVTAGEIMPEPRVEFFKHMDAVNVDFKAFTDKFYRQLTGAKLLPVLETMKYLKHETDCWFELTNLVIPGENDSDDELRDMSEWIMKELGSDVPLHFSAFHPDYLMLDHQPTPPATLTRARSIAQAAGLRYVYTGNVHDSNGQSTYCHNCGKTVIGRDWYVLSDYKLDEHGACSHCGTPCAGQFGSGPGKFGARRIPVRIADYA